MTDFADFAARVARSMGLTVRSSNDRSGRISSYYVTMPCGRRLRISDHDVPWTEDREARAGGRFCGSADIYASANAIRRPLWWRRAFTLAAAGRDVPGADA